MISKAVERTVPPAADDKRVWGEGKEVQGRFADYATADVRRYCSPLNAKSGKGCSIFVVVSEDVRQQVQFPVCTIDPVFEV